MARRPSRAAAAQVLVRHRATPPGGRTVYAVHPGALPVGTWANLAGALPQDTGFAVLDVGAVPAYMQAAMDPGASDLTVDTLLDILIHAYRADLGDTERGVEAGLAPPVGHDGAAGPVTFVGWSFGGVLAHGMTERLKPEERPDGIVLLDSIAPTETYTYAEDDYVDPVIVLRWFAMFLGAKRGTEVAFQAPPVSPAAAPAAAVPTSTAGADHVVAGLERLLRSAVTCGALPEGTPVQSIRKLFDAYMAGLLRNNRLTSTYRPRPATVPLTQIKAQHSLIPSDPTLGWAELADRTVEAHSVPGDHYTMLIRPDASRAIAGLIPAARPPQLVTTRRDTQ
ncbi:thioesterase [Streptomyces sp. DSM 41972]|uniref:Thioesterase n=1 Tax=Streptomyces althioticus subsp. attaecolombicae TaxID=3075534 RepID=A0ABU3I4E4_9ACTN|nr:thioesterase [Streptomyces sp. DSM 41972]SCD92595.1 Thioesterase domain-containing protein [Streptomyces sp. di50b]SCE38557.1 Thioesterase domain-containing protein [Streptomyces sp. di188]